MTAHEALRELVEAKDAYGNILPCPFCGETGLDFREGTSFRWLAYSCSECGIGSETRVQTMGEGTNDEWLAQAKADAVASWNKRAPLPELRFAG